MDALTNLGYDALDRGVIPDPIVRRAIRYLCNQRLKEIASSSIEEQAEAKWKYVEDLKQRPVAIETEKANEQHYEVRPGGCSASEQRGGGLKHQGADACSLAGLHRVHPVMLGAEPQVQLLPVPHW